MSLELPLKVSKIRDNSVISAIINLIGMVVVSDILFMRLGWVSLLPMFPVYIYFFKRSISLALARCWMIGKLNNLAFLLYSNKRHASKSVMLTVLTGRPLYFRRLQLLHKHYAVHLLVYRKLQTALDVLVNMDQKTLDQVSDILKEADQLAKTKIFLDKK